MPIFKSRIGEMDATCESKDNIVTCEVRAQRGDKIVPVKFSLIRDSTNNLTIDKIDGDIATAFEAIDTISKRMKNLR